MESDSATPGPSAGAHAPPGAKIRPWSSLPLFHAAWLFALGIVAAKLVWLRPSVVLVALAMMAVFVRVAATRAQRVSWLALAPFWILLGAWCAEMEPQPAPAPVLGAMSDGLLRTVEGTVMDAGPVRGANRRRSRPGFRDCAEAEAHTAPRPARRVYRERYR